MGMGDVHEIFKAQYIYAYMATYIYIVMTLIFQCRNLINSIEFNSNDDCNLMKVAN